MATTKISQLQPLTSVASGDLFLAVDVSDTSMAPTGTDKKLTSSNLLKAVKPVASDGFIFVSPEGDDETGDGLSWGSALATVEAAKTAMGTTVRGTIMLSNGVHEVDGTLSLSGYRCVLQGNGPGTILRAVDQTGPVLDLEGWLSPGFEVIQEFCNFAIEGDGTSGTTKKGLRCSEPNAGGISGASFRNISARYCGGTPFDYTGAQLCSFVNMVSVDPVGAAAPFHYAAGATNGNRFIGLGCRSLVTTATYTDAVLFESDNTYAPGNNVFLAPWFEFLHLPTGGSLIHIKGFSTSIIDPSWFDNSKVAGAVGTCYTKFTTPAHEGIGANKYFGLVIGNQGGLTIDYGVIVDDDGTSIEGERGYNGNNVWIKPGTNRTFVHLKGAQVTPSGTSVVDDSGTATNVILETFNGQFKVTNGLLIDFSSQPRATTSGDHRIEGMCNPNQIALGQTVQNVSVDGAVTFNANSGRSRQKVNLAANATSSSISFPFYAGHVMTIEWVQDVTGGRTYSWPSTCRFVGGSAPSNTTASTRTNVTLEYDDVSATWVEVARSVAVPI